MSSGKDKRAAGKGAALRKYAMKKKGPQLYIEIGERTLSELGYWATENGLVLKEDEVVDIADLTKDITVSPNVGGARLVVDKSRETAWVRIFHDAVLKATVLIKGEEIVGIELWRSEDVILIRPCIPSKSLDDVFEPSAIFSEAWYATSTP